MTADELLAYLDRNPETQAVPPAGWMPMLDIPIEERRPYLDYLMADGSIRHRVPGVSNTDLIVTPGVAVAWRRSDGEEAEWLT